MDKHITYTSAKSTGQRDSLGSQLCFSVYSAMLAFNKVYRHALKALDVTYPQYLVLMLLREGDNVSMSGISQRLKLESSTLSPLLKRMEEQGILVRKRYAFDERQIIISLTEKGATLVAKAGAVPAYVARASGLTSEENKVLRALLAKLNGELLAYQQEMGIC
jgi:DNA-binding MarR family transcriptional regulator